MEFFGKSRMILLLISQFLVFSFTAISQDISADEEVFNRLAGGLTFKTISYDDKSRFEGEEFIKFGNYVEESYPLVHKHIKKEVVNKYSLLYTWEGINKA